jgi:sulfur relay protein TusB/DsrH
MTIYLVDEPHVDTAVSYASLDDSANVVLLQDAVYSASRITLPVKVYLVEDDLARRGLKSKISPKIRVISYDELVQMMKKEKVINFL